LTSLNRDPSPANVRHLDALGTLGRSHPGRAQFGVPVVTVAPDAGEGCLKLGIRRTTAQQRAQVVPARREQAREQLAFDGEAGAGAGSAERLRDARNDADLARPVAVPPPFRYLTEIVRVDRLERKHLVNAPHDLRRGN